MATFGEIQTSDQLERELGKDNIDGERRDRVLVKAELACQLLLRANGLHLTWSGLGKMNMTCVGSSRGARTG